MKPIPYGNTGVNCCLNCPNRKRYERPDGTIYDCHDHCAVYLEKTKYRREYHPDRVARQELYAETNEGVRRARKKWRRH